MERKLLMTTSTGGNSEDYNPYYCNFWLVERETIDKKDFEKCRDEKENFPEETPFLEDLKKKGYSVVELEQPDCLLFDDDE